MSRDLRVWRARPHGAWLVALLAALLLSGRALQAQVPTQPGDTVPADTAVVTGPGDVEPGDTVPTAIAQAAESAGVVPPILSASRPLPASWASARWLLDAANVGLEPGITLLEVIERLPGFARFRPGGYGRPEGLTAVGLGGARVRVIVDGRELLPFGAGAFELESIQLLDIETLEVERTQAEVRIEVTTYHLDQAEAHSVVELGTGVYQTRLLRALFSRGFGTRSAGTGGFDLVTTRGSGIREPYSHSSAVFRYAFAPTPTTTLQAEWRRTAIDREGTDYARQTTRVDLTVWGRAEVRDGVLVEGIVSRVGQQEESEEAFAYDAGGLQGVVRGVVDRPGLGAEASVRVRSLDDAVPPAPTLDAEARLNLSPLPLVRVEATAHHGSGDGVAATTLGATGIISPVPTVSVFAGLTAGDRLVTRLGVVEEGLTGELLGVGTSGWRGGVEVNTAAVHAGLAAFQNGATTVVPFSLGFDRAIAPVDVPSFTGIEASFGAPVPGTRGALSIEGWYVRMPDALGRPYAPTELARGGIRYHGLYYGGQLEPLIRVEGLHRGQARGPRLGVGDAFDAIAPAYQTLNVSLQLRIIDVQAFFIWDNLLVNRRAVDLVGDPQAYPRIVYGAEWRFRG